ncbi:MAG: B12-binding domain-containing radical SAM protein [Deltaproteobacteria bacterium]|nr:B12-binding domain-containing radical SAM protein [Deltaproteobacteria bacterium]
MRILLISPRLEYPVTAPGWEARPAWLNLPQMSLLILKALSPEKHQVTTVEEEREAIPWSGTWDLVGITVMTATAPRAYKLAKIFRATGARVILGGIHPSVLPEEARQYADAVLVGEAESLWGQVLDDAERHQLKPYYHHDQERPEVLEIPLVHYEQQDKPRGPVLCPVITSRGCPFRCEFCSVSQIYGSRVRNVPISRVLAQIEPVRDNYVAFLDDNLTTSREYALELFSALSKLRVKFIAQVPLRFILDEDLFHRAVAAGLKGMLVGFESIAAGSRKHLKKAVSLADTGLAIRRARAAGVMLHGSFIFGLDEHDQTIFSQTLDFIMEHQIPSISAYVLTPYPGTVVFQRLASAGRLLHRHWAFYDHISPVFHPLRLSLEELAQGYLQFRTALYSLRGIARRFLAGMAVSTLAYLQLNLAFRQTTLGLKEHYQAYFRWLEQAQPAFPEETSMAAFGHLRQ